MKAKSLTDGHGLFSQRRTPRERAAARMNTGPLLVSAILLIGDLAVLEAAIGLGTWLRLLVSERFPISVGPRMFLGFQTVMILLPLGYWFAGLYPGYGRTAVERLRARVTVSGLGFGGLILFDYLAQNGQWSRGVLLTAAIIVLITIPIWDSVARRRLARTRWWGLPAAIWGPDEQRAALVRSLRENSSLGWVPATEGEWPEPGAPALPGIALAILIQPRRGAVAHRLPDDLPYRRVVLVPEIDEMQSLWVSVRDLGARLGLEMQRNLLDPTNRVIKRALDVVLCLAGAPVAAPLIAISAMMIKLMSPGPAFFSQEREGLDGRPFKIWKLRTMELDADARLARLIETEAELRAEWERHMKLRYDPRIIRGVGRFLRRFSIDELPQLWNVLRGDMSLVGPRPLPDYHLRALDPASYRLRRRVRPGITGLWQVSGRSDRPLAELERLDTYYVRNWSFWLDLHILLHTAGEVLRGNGAW